VLVLSEACGPEDRPTVYLAEQLIRHRAAVRVAKDMCDLLGWEAVGARLTPSTVQVRHGDFGEMIATEILGEFGGLHVPVRKVRYQIHADQTLVGADVVALGLDGEDVVSVHFAEAKYRGSADTSAADSAHRQLAEWHRNEFGDILFFVGSRLEELDPELYAAFFRYLKDIEARADCFHIVLVWEAQAWSDNVLHNLPDPQDQLSPLTVRVVLIENLDSLTGDAYRGMEELVRE
jgi:hypothetical protein